MTVGDSLDLNTNPVAAPQTEADGSPIETVTVTAARLSPEELALWAVFYGVENAASAIGNAIVSPASAQEAEEWEPREPYQGRIPTNPQAARIPGYNAPVKGFWQGLGDFMDDLLGDQQQVSLQGRSIYQVNVANAMAYDANNLHMSYSLVNFAEASSGGPDYSNGSLQLTGWAGNTWQMSNGTYFIDRNGDGYPDIEVINEPNNVQLVNYGDGKGFNPYNPSTYLQPLPTVPFPQNAARGW